MYTQQQKKRIIYILGILYKSGVKVNMKSYNDVYRPIEHVCVQANA